LHQPRVTGRFGHPFDFAAICHKHKTGNRRYAELGDQFGFPINLDLPHRIARRDKPLDNRFR
jgi:hypothetical protein